MARRDLVVGGAAAVAVGASAWPVLATGPAPGDAALRPAFFYGFPLYEFARTAQDRTRAVGGSPGTLNTIAHRAQLQDHTSRQVTGPNNDTIYSSAFLELSGGPVELSAPTDLERYFSIAFMDAFTDNFAYIGARATGGRGGRFWIVGPQWTGRPPAGTEVIRAPTNDVWMLARILIDGAADLPAAQALQRQITLSTPPGRPAARPYDVPVTQVSDAANFLAVVNEMLARSPGGGQGRRAKAFAGAGLGVSVAPGPALTTAWGAYIPKGVAELRAAFQFRDLVFDGWGYQEPGVGEASASDRVRAAVALGGLAALGEAEAMYVHATRDADGQLLSGARRYRWRVPPGGVPVDAFWSLTMYAPEADGRYFLVDNPIRRYAIGDRTPGLVFGPDGSLEILVQHERPEGALAANWLPAPAGPLRLALRAYLPRKSMLERRWRVPPLVRVA